MTISYKNLKHFTLAVGLLLMTIGNKAHAQANDDSKAIIAAMTRSTAEWDKGHLEAFMKIYDPSATMNTPKGNINYAAIKALYQNTYFKGSMPKQNLRYTDLSVRMLGDNYALLTGGFILYGNKLPSSTGRYSLVMVKTKLGWKILHDHSS